MRKTPTYCSLVISLLVGTLQAQRGTSFEERRIVFDNRSSSPVAVYKRTSTLGKYKVVSRLAPGEGFATIAEAGDHWTVATPNYYRLVEALDIGRGWMSRRRVVITDRDLKAIGDRRVEVLLTNRTGRPVTIFKNVAGHEVAWSQLGRGQRRSYYSYQGREWIIRDRETGEELDRCTTGARSASVSLEDRRGGRAGGGRGGSPGDFGGGLARVPGAGGSGRGWGSDPSATVTMTVINNCARPVLLLRRTTFGSRTVGQLGARQSGRVETQAGSVWTVEDARTFETVKTVTVPSGQRFYELVIAEPPAPRPTPPPPPSKITVRFHNDTPEIIYIYKVKDGRWKYTKRIYPGRFYNLDFDPGQKVSVRDPKTGRELETFEAPGEDTTLHIRDHGDHAHAVEEPEHRHSESDHRHSHRQPQGRPPSDGSELEGEARRRLFRRLFGG